MNRTIRNECLADAIAAKRLSSTDLAVQLRVDPRTVDRWVQDAARVPRPAVRLALARLVEVPPARLWPSAATGPQFSSELVAMYPHRTALPISEVTALLRGAKEAIDILALAGLWLWDAVPGFADGLAAKAADGVRVRCCLGDPAGSSARLRGEEEGSGERLRHRCEIALTYAQRALASSPESLRVHDTTLYTSMLRFDEDLLVNWHLYGAAAADAPVLHLRHTDDRGVAGASLVSFERVWGSAYPLVG